MKFIPILLCFLPFALSAQLIVDGENLNESDLPFITVSIDANTLTGKARVIIDHGQEAGGFIGAAAKITNQDGDKVEFKGVNQAIYYIIEQGWQVAQFISRGDGRLVYIMSKTH